MKEPDFKQIAIDLVDDMGCDADDWVTHVAMLTKALQKAWLDGRLYQVGLSGRED